MRNDEVVQFLNTYLDFCVRNYDKKLVVGIDGTSGVGKTSINLNLVFNRKDATIISLDCYKNKTLGSSYSNWFDIENFFSLVAEFKSSNFGGRVVQWTRNGIEKKLTVNFSKKILIIDGVFLCDRTLFQDIFDKIIYFNAGKTAIEKRRFHRTRLKNLNKESIAKKKTQFDSFDRLWEDYVNLWQPQKNADMVINI